MSDAKGRVTVRNIPRWLDEYRLFHDDYELAESRQPDVHYALCGTCLSIRYSAGTVVLREGKTTKGTITLRPKEEKPSPLN